MKVIVDNRGHDCKYIDKDKLDVANNKELIKLQVIETNSPIAMICHIIASINKLNDNEEVLYTKAINLSQDKRAVSINELKESFHSSESTFNRTINSLRNKGFIYYINEGKNIEVSSLYFIDKNNIEDSKYLIIDFNRLLNL